MAIAAAADSTAEQIPNPTADGPAGKSGEASPLPDHGETNGEDYDDDYEEVDDEEGGEELDGPAAEKEKIDAVFRRLSSAPVDIRVHDIIIKGNSKTRDALIEAEVTDLIRSAATVQDLLRAASLATGLLRNLEVLDSVHITLDAGPPELPGPLPSSSKSSKLLAPFLEASAACPRRRQDHGHLKDHSNSKTYLVMVTSGMPLEHMDGTSHQR